MKTTKSTGFLVLSLVLCLIIFNSFAGCSAKQTQSVDQGISVGGEPAKDNVVENSSQEGTTTGLIEDRKEIREGSMSISIKDAIAFAELVKEKTTEMKGYISDYSQNRYELEGKEYVNVSLIVRVPETSFDTLITWIGKNSKVENKNISGYDVTEQYIDVEARLKNLKAEEVRLQEMYGQAKTVQDMLAVEAQLSRVRGEIESLQGQMNYFENRIKYSTLSLSISEEIPSKADFSKVSISEFFNKVYVSLMNGIYSFLNFVTGFFITLSFILPYLLFIAVVAVILIIIVKRKKE